VKTGVAAAAGIAGLLAVLGGVGALSFWSRQSAIPHDDWRPVCAAHHGWGDMDVEMSAAEEMAPTIDMHWVLFGLDMSPSNRALASTQLDEISAVMRSLPPQVGTSTLLVSDRSDLSSTPDLPLDAGLVLPSFEPHVTGVSCWPECPTDSLAAQTCFEQVSDALEVRRQAATLDAADTRAAAVEAHLQARRERVAAWLARVEDWKPRRPGTSIVRFFHKVADLPPVRERPDHVTLYLLSDLEEARTQDRRSIDAIVRHHEKHGSCPVEHDLPNLEGLHVVLVQSVQARVDAERWAERWRTVLSCTGANVEVRRYSTAVPLHQLVEAERHTWAAQSSRGSTVAGAVSRLPEPP